MRFPGEVANFKSLQFFHDCVYPLFFSSPDNDIFLTYESAPYLRQSFSVGRFIFRAWGCIGNGVRTGLLFSLGIFQYHACLLALLGLDTQTCWAQ